MARARISRRSSDRRMPAIAAGTPPTNAPTIDPAIAQLQREKPFSSGASRPSNFGSLPMGSGSGIMRHILTRAVAVPELPPVHCSRPADSLFIEVNALLEPRRW
jgi:hypothetical protein